MINLEQARALVREVVAEQGPDFVYESGLGDCFYVPTKTIVAWVEVGVIAKDSELVGDLVAPGYDPTKDIRYNTPCLVGRVLEKAGETRQQQVSVVSWNVAELVKKFPDMMTGDAAKYLGNVQYHQDAAKSWGTALSLAEGALV